jgi:hypothetical protein
MERTVTPGRSQTFICMSFVLWYNVLVIVAVSQFPTANECASTGIAG